MASANPAVGNSIFLPYVDLKTIYNIAKGQTGSTKKALLTTMAATPIALFNCPTRRASIVYPWLTAIWGNNYAADEMNAPTLAGRSDYAINAGCSYNQWGGGPGSYADGLSSTYGWQIFTGVNGTDPGLDGVCYVRSTVKLKEIIDGLSHTYLVAEKYLDPDFYNNGDAGGDNESLYSGFDNDNFRTSGWLGGYVPPLRDRSGYDDYGNSFGSPHPASWNASFCDGSVHSISYDIDQVLHSYLANRRDKHSVTADAIGR